MTNILRPHFDVSYSPLPCAEHAGSSGWGSSSGGDGDQLLNAILDSLPGVFYAFESNGRYLRWNKALETITGYSGAEISRMTPHDFFAGGERGSIQQVIDEVLLHGRAEIEAYLVTKLGEKIPFYFTGCRVELQGREAIVGMGIDISNRKRLQEQLFRTQRLESIGMLAGGIAHDLNNVLLPISMGAELLKREVTSSRGTGVLATLQASAKRGSEMVQQILSFAKDHSGTELEVLNPKYLLQELVGLLQQTFPKAIRVHLELAEDLWPVRCHSTQIQQVLMNLCVNSRDAMRDGGLLTVRASNIVLPENWVEANPASKTGPHVVISVRDTGCGIPPEVITRIFDPFFTTKPVGQGYGLGLSTSIGILRDHRGSMTVQSKLTEGTEISFYLPAADEEAASPAVSPKPEPRRANGETILVVDDEQSIRDMSRLVLEGHGYKVLIAGDGPEAISLFAQHSSEIKGVVIDMTMPVLSGPVTIRALRKIRPSIKVLPVSGVFDQQRTRELAELQLSNGMKKPYGAAQLLIAVKDLLLSSN